MFKDSFANISMSGNIAVAYSFFSMNHVLAVQIICIFFLQTVPIQVKKKKSILNWVGPLGLAPTSNFWDSL